MTTPVVPLLLYVSGQGNDAWSGTLPEPDADRGDGPLATLEQARDLLRQCRGSGPATVVVRGGTYPRHQSFVLGPQDSGSGGAPVTWQAAAGEEVRLTGGLLLPGGALTPVTDPDTRDRLKPAARDHVLCLDLAALGVALPAGFPDAFRGWPAAPEIFCDDRRLTPARWPNQGWAHVSRIVESGARPRDGDESGRLGTFEYAEEEPDRWRPETGVWLQGYWCYDWYDETLRIESLDRANRRITLARPHLYSLMQGNPSPRRYRALNLLEELDEPGEYVLDHAGQRLYVWLPEAGRSARLVLSTLDAPIIAVQGAADLVLRGFVVEAGMGDGILVRDGCRVAIEACTVRNLRLRGIRIEGGVHHRVEACDVHDVGTEGIVLAGGDRRQLMPAGHQALNNHIWRFSRLQFTSAYGLVFGGVGNRAAHNLIHDAPHQAVFVGGNDHVFELNVVHHVCTETDDCGALYKGRNPSCRGNLIRHNVWHHIGSPMGHGSAAIYFDDGDGGDAVIGNLFYRCGDPGKGSFGTVFSHGGHDNLAAGNVFVECLRPLGSAPWADPLWREAVNGGADCFWTEKLRQEVDISRPPFTNRYPELTGFLEAQPAERRVNRARGNLMVNCCQASSGNWQVPAAINWETEEDPGFVDAANGDYRLRPDAPVYRRLAGFQPLPLQQVGLQYDPLRPRPTEEEADGPTPRTGIWLTPSTRSLTGGA